MPPPWPRAGAMPSSRCRRTRWPAPISSSTRCSVPAWRDRWRAWPPTWSPPPTPRASRSSPSTCRAGSTARPGAPTARSCRRPRPSPSSASSPATCCCRVALLCGTVHLADIGIPDAVLDRIGPRTFANRPSLWRAAYPWPRLDGHKYTRGHAVVISGPPESTGAARMGARAALRVGAGLVTVAGSPAATAINATHETAVMVRAMANDGAIAEFLADARHNAVLIGPGAGVGRNHGGNRRHHSRLAGRRRARRRRAHLVRGRRGARRRCAPPASASCCAAPSRSRPAPACSRRSARARRPSSSPRTTGEFKRLFGELAGSKLERRPPRRRDQRRGRHPEGPRHRHRRPRRPRRHQRQRPAVARHRRRRRRAGRPRHRPAGARHAGLRGGLRRGLAARRVRQPCSARA